jgi:hypothetical protein
MAEALPSPEARKRKDAFSDETYNEKGSIEVAESIKGDVYDDIREIDMGEDGKERPIG